MCEISCRIGMQGLSVGLLIVGGSHLRCDIDVSQYLDATSDRYALHATESYLRYFVVDRTQLLLFVQITAIGECFAAVEGLSSSHPHYSHRPEASQADMV